jgi:hypothetical protein
MTLVALFAFTPGDGAVSRADELYAVNGVAIQWDNTLRYSAGFRLTPASPALLNNPNADDGDRDFAPGLISNRLDFVSVLDISRGEFGIQASADGWYDSLYHARTANDSPATFNALSVPNTRFPAAVRNLDGQYLELGDAFAYGNFTAAGVAVSVRIGRQSVLWGESVFFDENSIAAAQAPVDYLRNIGPQNYSDSLFLPVNQLSLTLQPRPNIAIAAYYQFEWRASRLPGVGGYFSDTDILGAGAERILLDNGNFLIRSADRKPTDGGHFGVALRTTLDEVDIGFYALRYASDYPELRFEFYPAPEMTGEAGEFHAAYPGSIALYGASISGYLGNSTIAGEIASRWNTPVIGGAAVQQYYTFESGAAASANYARGDTLHAQISALSTFAPTSLWDSANLSVEFGSTWLFEVTQNRSGIDLSRQRFVSSMRALFEPHYFEVLPNLDISLPVGFGYGLAGQSNLYFGPVSGAGDVEIGLSGIYRSVWKASLTFTGFVGAPARQAFADRDFVLFSVERSF